jgi:hypothetical protein
MAIAAGSGAAQGGRNFWAGMAIYAMAVVFIGFMQSFYLRGMVAITPRPNPTLPPAVMLHGLVFSVWMVLVVVQTQLVRAGRHDVHRALGMAGMVLALAMIPLMYVVAVGQVARASQPPGFTALNFTSVPLSAIPVFALLVALGWRERRNSQAHKRLMLASALIMLEPAWGRLTPPTLAGHAVGCLLTAAPFLLVRRHDKRTLGSVHWATHTGLIAFLLASCFQLLMLATGWWEPVAARLPGV